LISKLLGLTKIRKRRSSPNVKPQRRGLKLYQIYRGVVVLWKHNHWISLPEVNKILEKQVIIGEAY